MENHVSNYEMMKHQMQEKFAACDLEQAAGQWELGQEDDFLTLTFAGRSYWIDRSSGAILYRQNGKEKEADYNVSMTLFDILTRKRADVCGELRPVSSFSTIHSATASSGGFFDGAARRFDHRSRELAAACERLGGTPYGKGDVGYRIPVFRDLQIAVQFWESDEEFPPALHFFCDGNILQFMHFETMMFMLCHVFERLFEEMAG